MAIADLRREYNLMGLRRSDLAADPIAQFRRWFDQAAGARTSGRVRKFCIKLYKALLMAGGAEPMDLTAMMLATTDKRGFVFFTNYDSRKGRELAESAQAALVFYWSEQERQVCVAGEVSKLPPAESDAYFKSRPRGSRIAAWASKQSTVVRDRAALEERWKQVEAQYAGQEVPRPPHWGGYLLSPARMEFWQGRPTRLHDRFRYTRQADKSWLIERLSP